MGQAGTSGISPPCMAVKYMWCVLCIHFGKLSCAKCDLHKEFESCLERLSRQFESFPDISNHVWTDCILAPPKRGRYWEIHPRRPRDFPRARIQYLASF